MLKHDVTQTKKKIFSTKDEFIMNFYSP